MSGRKLWIVGILCVFSFLLLNTPLLAEENPPVGGKKSDKMKKKVTPGPSPEVVDYECLTADDNSFADYPCLASDGKDRVWLVWLSGLKNDGDLVLASEHRGKWSKGARITPGEGKYETPRIACASGGKPMAVWVKNTGNAWIVESSVHDGKKFAKPQAAVMGPGRAANPCLIAGKDNTFWLGWEVYEKGKFRVCLKQYTGGKWGSLIEVTKGKSNSYDPALALDKSGKLWITYSVAENAEKNIYLAMYDVEQGKIGIPIEIALGGEGPSMNSSPAVTCDGEGRVWVAWEVRELGTTDSIMRSYFGKKECRIVCYRDGKLWEVKPGAAGYQGKTVFGGGSNRFPTFAVGGGRLWLFSRNFHKPRRTWGMTVSWLEGDKGWKKPISLLDGLDGVVLGREEPPAVAIADKNSFWIAWQGDNYFKSKIPVKEMKGDIYVARIVSPLPEPACGPPSFKETSPGVHSRRRFGRPWVERRKLKKGKEEYTLLYGNLHEHTDLSVCHLYGADGILDDNYRWGRDVEGYDFAALTDHGFHLRGEVYWGKMRRAAQFYNDPPYFVALPAYEWTFGAKDRPPSSGHRNVIFASDEDAAKFLLRGEVVYGKDVEEANRIDKVWKALREKKVNAVTIPHHVAGWRFPVDWDFHDPEYQSVVEIFQIRGSDEYRGCPRMEQLGQVGKVTDLKGSFVQDMLARGYKMGFIASGDHRAMGTGIAALLVKEVSQKGIVDALLARRCYATTGDKIFIDFRVDGHLMGEEFKAKGKPRITATIETVKPLKSIVIFKNNKVIYEKGEDDLASRKQFKIDFTDNEFTGDSYYYLRVIQTNNEIAWSSPIWVNK
jgi:hypothetical protein